MEVVAFNQFLVLYSWFSLAALLFFLLLIARFYQKFSGKRTYFRLFAIPLVLFGASAVRYGSITSIAGDPLGDLLAGLAGLMLLVMCGYLYRCMLR